jgi:hypothetical protein
MWVLMVHSAPFAAHKVFFLEPPLSIQQEKQAMHRVRRLGQKRETEARANLLPPGMRSCFVNPVWFFCDADSLSVREGLDRSKGAR